MRTIHEFLSRQEGKGNKGLVAAHSIDIPQPSRGPTAAMCKAPGSAPTQAEVDEGPPEIKKGHMADRFGRSRLKAPAIQQLEAGLDPGILSRRTGY
jgi:hypothetical protein